MVYMNIFFKSLCYFFILLGSLASFTQIHALILSELNDFIFTSIIAMNIIASGLLGLKAIVINYKGGISSIIGVFFVFIGSSSIGKTIDNFIISTPNNTNDHLLIGLIFLFIGACLIYSGHQYHKLKLKERNRIN